MTLTALLCLLYNGGISIGFSNHLGLLPVVRRMLHADYLPDDFGIAVRFYHHRVFAYIVAGLAWIVGEDTALILLRVIGVFFLSAALFALCRTLRLTTLGFLALGCFLAMGVLRSGRGLEVNDFLGPPEIMPPIFAHALILLAVSSLLNGYDRLTAFLCGVVLLLHLQIGFIFALVLMPYYILRIRRLSLPTLLQLPLWVFLPAAPALLHLSHMAGRGLNSSALTLSALMFRQSHHFALLSVSQTIVVAANLALQVAVYWWLSRSRQDVEAHRVAVLLSMSSIIALLSMAHAIDVYLLHQATIAKLQFIRLSPFITVFGILALIVALHGGVYRLTTPEMRGKSLVMLDISLIVFACCWSISQGAFLDINRPLVKKYAEQTTSWVDICRWINRYGPRNTVYLTPPGQEGFVYLANRSTVVEFKINPDGGQFLEEWFARLRDLAGGNLSTYTGFGNEPQLNRAFGSLGEAELLALGKKYHARYAVLSTISAVNFEEIYRNRDYRLVRLP